MNLLVNQLKNAIKDLLAAKGLNGTVRDKVNAKGELVIAVVMQEVCEACDGTGRKLYPPGETTAAGDVDVGE